MSTVIEPRELKWIASRQTSVHHRTDTAWADTRLTAMNDVIHREVRDDQICVLTFDRPDSAANIFDLATLHELNAHLDSIAADSQLKGLVFASAKKSIFIAGADIKSLFQAGSDEALTRTITLGQDVFNRIAALPIPTAAAIHGACLGGGFEICLACDWRVASPDRSTRIGLPETQLGILPAWGGSTRLPRLIGLPKALDIILAGKTLATKPALKCGMIDDIAPQEYLVDAACRLIRKGKAPRPARFLVNNPLVASIIAARVRPQLSKKTRGHYPAVTKALEVVTAAVSSSVEKALQLERDAILELARTETCRNLIRIFFLQERAKKLDTAPGLPAPHPTERVAVIGAGVMGAGIAQWASARQLPVILRDINPEFVGKGMVSIAKLYDEGVKRHTFTKVEARAGLDRIFPSATDVPLRHVDLVIEAAVEKMELKKKIFQQLDELSGPNTILATNTSALSISEIATGTTKPQNVVGIHFFNPVHRMQLVEVVVGRQTSGEVVRRAVKFVQHIGKLPVVVKDSPGFLVNRILMPYLIEAGHLFESGARVEDVDACMLDFGMPMGPLRLIDEVGVDVSLHVADDLAAKFSDRLRVPAVLSAMFSEGLLGRKSGLGFYAHNGKKKEASVNAGIDRFHASAGSSGFSRAELQSRLVMLMINEAARCLEERVVAEPADVDFGMIMGTGFAPFRGGPLRYAEALGLERVVEEMKRLAGSEPRFAPCALLQRLASEKKTFYEV